MDIDHFIRRWSDREGGAERANASMYLLELTLALYLPPPDPASATTAHNDYVFERAVRSRLDDGAGSPRRIDLYKRGCFLLEAKQSRWPGRAKAVETAADQGEMFDGHSGGPRDAGTPRWDALMRNARKQAFDYVRDLPPDHPAPPFLIVCDVGRVFELWADFTGTGRGYAPFPDRKSYRLGHADLAAPETRALLRAIWTDPSSLDPTRRAARITREIVDELAVISRRLEGQGYPPEDVAHFLMRCIFTIFAADVGLLPKARLLTLLQDCAASPASFAPLFNELWRRLNDPDHGRRFFSGFGAHVPHINGGLFSDARVLPLGEPELARLLMAARRDWRQVEPAIFGALLEHALDPGERRKLGAHYTPRAYVERLVELTVMEPLRDDWRLAQTRAEQARDDGDGAAAVRVVRQFHRTLCATRVLDPACGTGNFLYISLDLMKRLEGEVLETLADLGHPESLGLDTIDPRQFLGLELNPRAAAIAELVLWIGWLQQHYKTHNGHPAEPILKAHGNIRRRDAVLARDAAGTPTRPDWPEAEFIVGNPPFIGGKDLRSRLDPGYAEALWSSHPWMNESADLVMYWWDRAADILARPGSCLRRFGFVTTNSISQVFQRRTVERWLSARSPVSLAYAIKDHPWTCASRDAAAVRIAMTVAVAGRRDGVLFQLAHESGLDSDEPRIELSAQPGRINADLSVGVDVTRAGPLAANAALSSPGVKLHGAGFIITRAQAAVLGLGQRPGLERHIRPYRNGRDLTGHSRDALVIDLHGLEIAAVRRDFPEVYQHLAETVRTGRAAQFERSPTADARAYLNRWWEFGKPRPELRVALDGLPRYIATVETAKHRVFQFLDAAILPDNKLIAIATSDAAHLALLSSQAHRLWYLANSGRIGVYDQDAVYVKSRCFDPFPFPDLTDAARARLATAAEEMDALRKRVLADHPDLTLTGLYNVLEAVRAGAALSERDASVRDRGLVLILRDLHDDIDRAVAEAYGWPADLEASQGVARLAALNAERARDEGAGRVRWLRPDFQRPRLAVAGRAGDLALPEVAAPKREARPTFPRDRYEQPLALVAALRDAPGPVDAPTLSRAFSRGGARIEPRIAQVLTTLHRYGHVERLTDGRYVARRAA